MLNQVRSKMAVAAVAAGLCASAYSVICYGGYQQLTSSGEAGEFTTN